jgi:hypothetical protein
MVKLIRVLAIVLLSGFLGCETQEGFTSSDNNLSDFENSLIGNWQYVSIEVAGNQFNYADQFTEPGFLLLTSIGQRAEIERRMINYGADKLYQLRWTDRGKYQLGTEGDSNWQPNFGYWHNVPETNRVFHNEGLYYSVEYTISFSNNLMTRVSARVMSSDFDAGNGRLWNKGDTVTFKEVFQRID